MRYLMLSLLFVLAAFGADITGKWKAEFEFGGQTRTATFDFKTEGSKLTGTVTGARGGPAPIVDGQVNGDDVSFSVIRKLNDQDVKVQYKGKVSGGRINFKVTTADREFEITASKES